MLVSNDMALERTTDSCYRIRVSDYSGFIHSLYVYKDALSDPLRVGLTYRVSVSRGADPPLGPGESVVCSSRAVYTKSTRGTHRFKSVESPPVFGEMYFRKSDLTDYEDLTGEWRVVLTRRPE